MNVNGNSEYASGLKDVLIRKINKTEQSLHDLKLDYCRFVYGLSHRSKVVYDQVVYQVSALDLDIMERTESGDWTKPGVKAIRHDPENVITSAAHSQADQIVDLGQHWDVYGA